jgi:hypothetical protein
MTKEGSAISAVAEAAALEAAIRAAGKPERAVSERAYLAADPPGLGRDRPGGRQAAADRPARALLAGTSGSPGPHERASDLNRCRRPAGHVPPPCPPGPPETAASASVPGGESSHARWRSQSG